MNSRPTITYIDDLPWEYSYRSEIAPLKMRFAMAAEGLQPQEPGSYCELAYGQGVSLVIHAACNQEIDFYGTDLNSGHFEFAKGLSDKAELKNLTLAAADFSSFLAARPDTRFDLVGMTGTWSWLPITVQDALLEALPTHLNANATFCFDHSTLPGNSSQLCLHRILSVVSGRDDHATGTERSKTVANRISAALEFFQTNPEIAHVYWDIREDLLALVNTDPNHAVHEFLNRERQAEYFVDLATRLARIGLQWASSASASSTIEHLHLTPLQTAYLKRIKDTVGREQLRDFIHNTGYRTDIWLKTAKHDRFDRRDVMETFRFTTIAPPNKFDYQFTAELGETVLDAKLYGALLQAMSAIDLVGLTDLYDTLKADFTFDEICDAMMVLVEKGAVGVTKDCQEVDVEQSSSSARALNHVLMSTTMSGTEIPFLGSPVTGGGVKAPYLHQLFLLAREDGGKDQASWVRFAGSNLAKSKKEQWPTSLIEVEAEKFDALYLPIYSKLLICDPPTS